MDRLCHQTRTRALGSVICTSYGTLELAIATEIDRRFWACSRSSSLLDIASTAANKIRMSSSSERSSTHVATLIFGILPAALTIPVILKRWTPACVFGLRSEFSRVFLSWRAYANNFPAILCLSACLVLSYVLALLAADIGLLMSFGGLSTS